MRVLVTGASSLLGRYLRKTKPRYMEMTGTWYTNATGGGLQLDVMNQSQVQYVFSRVRPHVVIHMGGIGDVGYCELNPDISEEVVVRGTLNVLRAAKDYKSRIIYTSTNAVYSGEKPPYAPDSERKPVNQYGRLRKRAEDVVNTYKYGATIARLFLLYGIPPEGARNNWATNILRALEQGEPLNLVNDRWWQPTYAGDVAQLLWIMAEKNWLGGYNVAGGPTMTLYEFGVAIAKAWNLDASLITPIETLPEWAPRPVDSSYHLWTTTHMHEVPEGLEFMKKELAGWYNV